MTSVVSRPAQSVEASGRFDSLVVRLRHDRRVRVTLALLVCAVAAGISSLGMPRGPQRPGDVVIVMLTAAVVVPQTYR